MPYQIKNRETGDDLGKYEGEDKDEALDAMAHDAGYSDYDSMAAKGRLPGREDLEAVHVAMSPEQYTTLRKKLGLSYAALAPLIDRSTTTAQSYAKKGPPDTIAEKMRSIQKRGLTKELFARISGMQPPLPLSESQAAKIAGEPVSLLTFSSKGERYDIKYGVGESGQPYSYRATGGTLYEDVPFGGEWTCKELSLSGGTVDLRRNGRSFTPTHQHTFALAWAGEKPFPEAEAYRPDKEKPASAENIGWRAKSERLAQQENWRGKGAGVENRPTRVRLSNELGHAIRKEHPEEVRRHGIIYVVEKLLRQKMRMEPPLTPHQRRTGSEPNTKAARIRLAAHRDPSKTKPEFVGDLGDVSPSYVGKVLSESGVSLRELRTRKMIDDAAAKSRSANRRRAIIQDAESGLYSAREIGEKYDIKAGTVRKMLSKEGVSLAEAKRRHEKETREKHE